MQRPAFLIFCLLFIIRANTSAQYKTDLSDLDYFVDSIFHSGINNGLIKSGIVSIVSSDTIIYSNGYGYSDSMNVNRVNKRNSLFQIGSIGKIFTAIAVLQLVDEGLLDLDKDISKYLNENEIDIDDSFEHAITLRHLLTHTAGFDERLIGYAARSKDNIEPLHDHLRKRLPRRYIEPGKEISYSNYGYALAGEIVASVSGKPFTDFIQQRILSPLRMDNTNYNLGNREEQDSMDYVRGYKITPSGFKIMSDFYRHPIPAGGIYSTSDEMAIFTQLFLNKGKANGVQVVSENSVSEMLRRQFSNHKLLNGYSLGFEEQSFSGINAFAKGGSVPGFRSILIIYPDNNLGLFLSINVDDDAFLETFVESFNSKYITSNKGEIPKIKPLRTDIDRFTGSYRENRYSRHDIEDLPTLINTTLWENDQGYLSCYQDGSVQHYVPIDTLVFMNKNDSSRLIVFHENRKGKITGFSRGNKFAGTLVPVRYEKLKWYERQEIVNEAIGFILIGVLSFLLSPVFRLLVFAVRKFRSEFMKNKLLPMKAALTAFIFSLICCIYLILYFFPVIREMKTGELYYGMDSSLIKFHYLPYVMIAVVVILLFESIEVWIKKYGTLFGRIYYSIFTFSGIIFLLFLHTWHFIGFNY